MTLNSNQTIFTKIPYISSCDVFSYLLDFGGNELMFQRQRGPFSEVEAGMMLLPEKVKKANNIFVCSLT